MKTNTTPLTDDLREWVSPNGVTHLLDEDRCLTCGGQHEDERARRVSAELYVQTRFFPPLPSEYGEYAVQAVDACNEDEPDRVIVLDHRLPVHPRAAVWYGDHRVEIEARELVDALRLWHMIDDAA